MTTSLEKVLAARESLGLVLLLKVIAEKCPRWRGGSGSHSGEGDLALPHHLMNDVAFIFIFILKTQKLLIKSITDYLKIKTCIN